MEDRKSFDLRRCGQLGLLAGGIALSLNLIGMVELFNQRDMVAGIFTLGHLILLLPMAAVGFMLAREAPEGANVGALLMGLVSGLIGAAPLILLVVAGNAVDLRQFLFNVSPGLIEFLTFSKGLTIGSIILAGLTGLIGLAGSGVYLLPERHRKPILGAIAWTFLFAMLSEILLERMRAFFGAGVTRLIFKAKALRPIPALLIFLLAGGISVWNSRRGFGLRDRLQSLSPDQQRNVRWASIGLVILLFILLPVLLGTYLSEVIDNVGIFVLMGLVLNIVVGFAGLLDLGYVAFFAIGAYTMAVLTTESPLGIGGLSFWAALPICVAMSALAGIILGIPVLRMRGDYLAIVTLGFGEIIRILALSDFLKPYIGGAQGVLQIPKPSVGTMTLVQPNQLYYVVLAGCLLAAFVAWRLSEARLGRQWMAIREDEDVAEAMGIKLVSVKLLAFAFGASFGGLAGAIFASKLTSIFPHSFSLLISINVLCLIIVGGMGSLPGVVIGALVLVGLPELLREFKEYRLLMYGAVLIVMMVTKPEGFWPSQVRRRELRAAEQDFSLSEAEPAQAGD